MTAVVVVHLALQVLLSVVLWKRFRSTGNRGFLLLLLPLVLWGLITTPLSFLVREQVDRHAQGEEMVWPLSMASGASAGEVAATVAAALGLVQTTLLILGFLWIGRRNESLAESPPNSPLQPTSGELRSPSGG